MDELKEQGTPATEEEVYELSHTDKLVGVFTDPANTFEKTSQFAPKTIDWIVPLLLLIVAASLSNILMMSNPNIKYAVIEKQLQTIEQSLNEAVENGQMSQAEADTRLETIRESMESGPGSNVIFRIIGIVVFIFIIFFLVTGVFMLFAKFVLKGSGTYSSTMVGYGLPYYIVILQVIVMVILALSMDKFFAGTSVGAFMDADTSTFGGFLLSKLDVFSIWFYAIVSIGLAKMFKSDSNGKYFGMVFGLWIGFSLLLFFGGQVFPFLRWFSP